MRTKFTPQYRTELKEKIMQSAIKNFAKNRFDRTRMEDIATAAGLAKGTLYLYFKNKEDLFYAICEHNLEELKINYPDCSIEKRTLCLMLKGSMMNTKKEVLAMTSYGLK